MLFILTLYVDDVLVLANAEETEGVASLTNDGNSR
jgi:hypothetical protein